MVASAIAGSLNITSNPYVYTPSTSSTTSFVYVYGAQPMDSNKSLEIIAVVTAWRDEWRREVDNGGGDAGEMLADLDQRIADKMLGSRNSR